MKGEVDRWLFNWVKVKYFAASIIAEKEHQKIWTCLANDWLALSVARDIELAQLTQGASGVAFKC